MKLRRSANMRGFTLLEVLVSTVLLASVVVAVLGLSSQALRSLSRIQPHEVAISHAREQMNQILLLDALEPGVSSGSWEDGYRWESRITPSTRGPKPSSSDYSLFEIRVVISWGELKAEKTYALETTQWAKKVPSNASR